MESVVISRIQENTDQAKSFYFSRKSDDWFSFTPGQYITVELEINGKKERRAYSICTPSWSDEIGFTVKRVDNGLVSNYLIDRLREGDSLDLLAPQGRFILKSQTEKRRQHVFVGAGSGITPLMSMIQTVLEEEPKSQCFLIYGNQSADQIIFKNELDSLVRRYEGQLFVYHVLSKTLDALATNNIPTRIHKGIIDEILSDKLNTSLSTSFYLCGPGDFIVNIEEGLISNGVESKDIHKEFFTTVSASANDEVVDSSEGASAVTFVLDGEEQTIEVAYDQKILDVLMDNDIEAPYSCLSGSCSTCIAKILEGEVKMDVCYALDEDEIEEGFILACQAKPIKPVVKIDFDV